MARAFMKRIFWVMLIAAYAPSGFAADRIPVAVSILPQKYFVQQIGRDLVEVQVMVAPGASPHTYEPKPRQMADLARAKAYFAIGVAFERVWVRRIAAANPQMRVFHTDHGIEKVAMTAPHRHGRAHGHHGNGAQAHPDDDKPPQQAVAHEHALLDPHIWLSPALVKIQARTIMTALQEIDPGHRTVYAANYNRFAAALDELDAHLKAVFEGRQGLRFMVYHPSWGYFAAAYGLRQVPIEIEGKDPKPAHLQALIERARREKIRVIFVQPQFSTKSAEVVAREIGGQVVHADPLAENWAANLRAVAEKFKAATQ